MFARPERESEKVPGDKRGRAEPDAARTGPEDGSVEPRETGELQAEVAGRVSAGRADADG